MTLFVSRFSAQTTAYSMVDGRLTDPFAAYNVKYRAASKKKRNDESREDFVNRIWKTFPTIIMQLNANIEAAALAFNIDVKILKAIVAQKQKCSKAYTKARATAAAKQSLDEEASNLQRSNAGDSIETDKRLTRKHWPVDPDQKESDAHDALLVSIVENEGNLIETSKSLNLDTTYIMELLGTYDDLVEAKEIGLKIAVIQAEAVLATNAKSGNMTAIKMMLTNLDGDNWSDRQSISVSHTGFSPPEEKTRESVLELVKGGKNGS